MQTVYRIYVKAPHSVEVVRIEDAPTDEVEAVKARLLREYPGHRISQKALDTTYGGAVSKLPPTLYG